MLNIVLLSLLTKHGILHDSSLSSFQALRWQRLASALIPYLATKTKQLAFLDPGFPSEAQVITLKNDKIFKIEKMKLGTRKRPFRKSYKILTAKFGMQIFSTTISQNNSKLPAKKTSSDSMKQEVKRPHSV